MKTASSLIAEQQKVTVETVNDSEPIYLHQGEVIELMKAYASQALDEAANVAEVTEESKADGYLKKYTVDKSSILNIKSQLK